MSQVDDYVTILKLIIYITYEIIKIIFSVEKIQ